MRFSVGAVSDVGRGRPLNEDAYLLDDTNSLYAVADGMGGHRAGEVASATAIASLQSAFRSGASLPEAVAQANATVFAKAGEDPDLRGMGTTITAVTLPSAGPDGAVSALLAHVGDSRAYQMRDGDVTRVTEDHSLVEQLVREGRISPEEAVAHPQRAIITRALGIEPDVEVDTYRIDLVAGDRLVLCSDGLSNMVPEPAMADVLRRIGSPQEAAQTLVDMANEAGGGDNITLVIIDAHGEVTAEGAAASARLGAEHGGDPTGAWSMEDEDRDQSPEVVVQVNSSAPGPSNPGPPPKPTGRPRLRRAVLWALPVLLILGTGFAAVGWYARRTFYVGLAGDQVTLYRGVPGGLLGWQPTVEDRTDLRANQLEEAQRKDLEAGHRFASRTEAARYIATLEPAPDEPTTGFAEGGFDDTDGLEPGPARQPAPADGPSSTGSSSTTGPSGTAATGGVR